VTQRPATTTHEAVAADLIARLERQVASVVKGKGDVIRQAVVCLLARGHVLIEDVPGVGKTTLAQSLASSLGLAFQRIQFTSDLLPSDIIGVSIYRQTSERFEYVPGPIFSNVVLASALLEAMSERHVTIDRERHPLPEPFIVLATQNPLEYVGTFPLPESQLDRFMMSLRLGYPPREQERELLISGGVDRILADLEPIVSREDVLQLQARTEEVVVADKLADYILSLAEATRDSAQFVLGVSTRGVQNLYRSAQAMALCEGRPFATPDDVQRVAAPVFAHRLLLKNGGGGLEAARRAVGKVLDSVPIPV